MYIQAATVDSFIKYLVRPNVSLYYRVLENVPANYSFGKPDEPLFTEILFVIADNGLLIRYSDKKDDGEAKSEIKRIIDAANDKGIIPVSISVGDGLS